MATIDFGRVPLTEDERSRLLGIAARFPADWTIALIPGGTSDVVVKDASGHERGRGQFDYDGFAEQAIHYLERAAEAKPTTSH